MNSFTFGLTFDNKAILLYFGESFAKAQFAAEVAEKSKFYRRVDLYRNLIPDKIFDPKQYYERSRTRQNPF